MQGRNNNLTRRGRVATMPAQPPNGDGNQALQLEPQPLVDMAYVVENHDNPELRWTVYLSYLESVLDNEDFSIVDLQSALAPQRPIAPLNAIVEFGDGGGQPHRLLVPVPRFGCAVPVSGPWVRVWVQRARFTLTELKVKGSIARGMPQLSYYMDYYQNVGGGAIGDKLTVLVPPFCVGRPSLRESTLTVNAQFIDYQGSALTVADQIRNVTQVHPLADRLSITSASPAPGRTLQWAVRS